MQVAKEGLVGRVRVLVGVPILEGVEEVLVKDQEVGLAPQGEKSLRVQLWWPSHSPGPSFS